MSSGPWVTEMPLTIAIDTHAHLRRCFGLCSFLDHAAENLSRASQSRTLGVLMLAETEGCIPFEELVGLSGAPSGAWVLERTAEPVSLIARHGSGKELVLVAGRQIATRERLEVLSLASTAPIEDGLSTEEAIGAAQAAGAIPVLPWGFGKWWGARGEIVRRILEAFGAGELFVGDNGNRPRCSPRPRLFREAERRGLLILPGSDPLSLPDQVERVGRYGTILTASLDRKRPAAGIEAALRGRQSPFPLFGRRVGVAGFLGAQIRIRRTGASRR